jgi:flagellar motor switch/type III secretory pathway protein FliN
VAIVEWLPLNALSDPRIATKLNEVLLSWTAQWFANEPTWSLGKIELAAQAQKDQPQIGRWDTLGSGLFFRATANEIATLGCHLVDAAQPAPVCSAEDNELLTLLATEALISLAEAIANALHIHAPTDRAQGQFSDTDCLILNIEFVASAPLKLQLALPTFLVVNYRKSLIAAINEPLPKTAELLSSVIANHSVRLRAPLGVARISIAALGELEKGDVIRLDTLLNGKFSLISARNGNAVCSAQLTQANGKLQIVAVDG